MVMVHGTVQMEFSNIKIVQLMHIFIEVSLFSSKPSLPSAQCLYYNEWCKSKFVTISAEVGYQHIFLWKLSFSVALTGKIKEE